LKEEKVALLDSIADKEAELAELTEIHTAEKELHALQLTDLMNTIEEERKYRVQFNISSKEVELLQQKLQMKDNEMLIQMTEWKDEKQRFIQTIQQLTEQLQQQQQQQQQQQRENHSSSVPSSHPPLITTTAAASSSSRSFPTIPSVPSPTSIAISSNPDAAFFSAGKKPLKGMRSQTLKKGDLSYFDPTDSLSSSSSPPPSNLPAALAEIKDDQLKIATLTSALALKVDQYVKLKEAYVGRADHIAMLEMALSDANTKVKEALEGPQRKIAELEQKLTVAETLCKKLLDREKQKRNSLNQQQQQQLQQHSGGTIIVPVNTNNATTSKSTTVIPPPLTKRSSATSGGFDSFF